MAIPTDPLFLLTQPEAEQQWHLQQRDAGEFDLNVLGAWADYSGEGVDVYVIDDGVDYTHSDLAPNYDLTRDNDFELNIADAFGFDGQSHGTAVAGIIGADDNGIGAVGIAFDATIIGSRVNSFISNAWLEDIRDAIQGAAINGGEVSNISQGMANAFSTIFGGLLDQSLVSGIRTSIGFAVETGRDGSGMIIVKSAGNSRRMEYDVNADMWTNDTRQVVVAAVDQDGFVSSYSSYGAANLISAFGTPGEVVTTDRVGDAGSTLSDFNLNFNGTSSAAPMVSGVVALILDANSALGWRDVQSILANSARHVGSEVGTAPQGSEREAWAWNGATDWNGGGLHYSIDYGYGLIDATSAVRMAETWLLGFQQQASFNEVTTTQDGLDSTTIIPDGDLNGTTFLIVETEAVRVDRVALTVNLSSTFMGDVQIVLTSPDGTTSTLINGSGGSTRFNGNWTFESQAFRGVSSAGQWSVHIVDMLGEDVTSVSDIVLQTFGTAISVDDRYVFTDEYSDFAGIAGHRTSISDSNGGTDTVNAAAVTSNSIINLTNDQNSRIDGINLTFFNMENAIAGDGNDMITGNNRDNSLYGMRGDDTLNGQGGADRLEGGTGNDIYVTDGLDTIIEAINAGIDQLRASGSVILAANIEHATLIGTGNINAIGNNLNNSILGNSGRNILKGGGGDDTLNGQGGADRLEGGTGNDIYVTDGLDTIIEASNAGIDQLLASRSVILSANIENATLIGTGNINATGNNLSNSIVGNSGRNILIGGGGNDTLNGQGGADRLEGGTGNDIYVTDGLDTIIEASNAGIDQLRASGRVILSANIENATLVGLGNINATGNNLNNLIMGNSGRNVLKGGDGNDTLNGQDGADRLEGGTGNDIYVTDGLDTIIEASNAGIDQLRASGSVILAANIENATLIGAGNINATGNNLNNSIVGNSGNNILNGGGGNDRLEGGAGIDTFVFNTALNATTNVDRIEDFQVADEIIRLENAIFTALTLTGTLAFSAFASNLSGRATDTDDRIIYEADTGRLFYDFNGSLAGGGIHFASLDANLALTQDNFFVV